MSDNETTDNIVHDKIIETEPIKKYKPRDPNKNT